MSKEKVSLKEWATSSNLENLTTTLTCLIGSPVKVVTYESQISNGESLLHVRVDKVNKNQPEENLAVYLNLPPFLKACLAKEIKSELAYERRESFDFYVIRFWEK